MPTTPFDQLFVDYAKKCGENVIKKHRKAGFRSCGFVHRKVHVEVPQIRTEPKLEEGEDFNRNTLLFFTSGERPYFLHVPSGVDVDPFRDSNSISYNINAQTPKRVSNHQSTENYKVPIVLLFHGTDETAFDGQLIEQKKGQQSWLDKSDKENFILVSLQARGMYGSFNSLLRNEGDYVRTLFKISLVDKSCSDYYYIRAVIEDVFSICPQADSEQIHVVGFSNGGYLACDLALMQVYQSPSSAIVDQVVLPENNEASVIPLFKEIRFKSICLYMGGLTDTQMEVKLGLEKEKLCKIEHIDASFVENGDNNCVHKIKSTQISSLPDIYIVTAWGDQQVFSCFKAWQCFHELGYYVQLRNLQEAGHEYFAEATDNIWDFISGAPHFLAASGEPS